MLYLKLHATRQRRHPPAVEKDWEDIVQIIRRHGLDLEAGRSARKGSAAFVMHDEPPA